jgi:hypothetical protein
LQCAICGQAFQFLGRHLTGSHSMSVEQYQTQYPDAPTITETMRTSRGRGGTSQGLYQSYEGSAPDDYLRQFLVGALLGDGSLEKAPNRPNARYADGGNNELYMRWRHELLSRYFHTSIAERVSKPDKRTEKSYRGWWVRTSVHPMLTEWHTHWYQPKKIVPLHFIDQYLSAFALTVWLCDDGHIGNNQAYLYTMAFSEHDTQRLAELLKQRFGLLASVLKNKYQQPYLLFGAAMVPRIRQMMSVFAIPGMEYKYISRG